MRRLAEIKEGDVVAIRCEYKDRVWFNLARMGERKIHKDYVWRLSDNKLFFFDAYRGHERGTLDLSATRTLCRATPNVVAVAVDDLPEGVTRHFIEPERRLNRG